MALTFAIYTLLKRGEMANNIGFYINGHELNNPDHYPEEITEWDIAVFKQLVADTLTPEQEEIISNPPITYPRQKTVLATHWHPEIVPLELCRTRIDRMFPNKEKDLIIPTQHNQILAYGDYAGVEVDCFSPSFNQKVQLLLHFRKEAVEGDKAGMLREMLAHTFRYRSGQLFEFIGSVVLDAFKSRLEVAATWTGASKKVVELTRTATKKFKRLMELYGDAIAPESIRNKLLTNYIAELNIFYDQRLINRCLLLLKGVKKEVKKHFTKEYFYKTEEVIEEGRALGCGIVIPHPEQFWPILLADYDIDGIEVWNPQSYKYTEFIIDALNRQNRASRKRKLLAFMGDDCHLGEKLKHPSRQDAEKACREIGLQPCWDKLGITKTLIVGNFSRERVIDEYKERLSK